MAGGKKKRQFVIAWQYLSPRCKRMMHRGDINKMQAHAAAMYVYFYRLQFLIAGPPTNFVKSERVDTSHNAKTMPYMGTLHVPDEIKSVLTPALIEEVSFKDLVTTGSRVFRHHRGKALFRDALSKFFDLIERTI